MKMFMMSMMMCMCLRMMSQVPVFMSSFLYYPGLLLSSDRVGSVITFATGKFRRGFPGYFFGGKSDDLSFVLTASQKHPVRSNCSPSSSRPKNDSVVAALI